MIITNLKAALRFVIETIQETPGAIEMELLRVPIYARYYLRTSNPQSPLWCPDYAGRFLNNPEKQTWLQQRPVIRKHFEKVQYQHLEDDINTLTAAVQADPIAKKGLLGEYA